MRGKYNSLYLFDVYINWKIMFLINWLFGGMYYLFSNLVEDFIIVDDIDEE